MFFPLSLFLFFPVSANIENEFSDVFVRLLHFALDYCVSPVRIPASI